LLRRCLLDTGPVGHGGGRQSVGEVIEDEFPLIVVVVAIYDFNTFGLALACDSRYGASAPHSLRIGVRLRTAGSAVASSIVVPGIVLCAASRTDVLIARQGAVLTSAKAGPTRVAEPSSEGIVLTRILAGSGPIRRLYRRVQRIIEHRAGRYVNQPLAWASTKSRFKRRTLACF
jgi:hypothetical protein